MKYQQIPIYKKSFVILLCFFVFLLETASASGLILGDTIRSKNAQLCNDVIGVIVGPKVYHGRLSYIQRFYDEYFCGNNSVLEGASFWILSNPSVDEYGWLTFDGSYYPVAIGTSSLAKENTQYGTPPRQDVQTTS